MKTSSGRLTEKDLEKILKNKNLKVSEVKKQNVSIEEIFKTTKKSKNENSCKKIIDSLKNCEIKITGSKKKGDEKLILWFEGARIMPLNEMLRTIQSNKYALFQYKKEWQRLMNRALLNLSINDRPFFDSECSFTLFRQGVKLIDLDGFQAAFKYAIDALCYEKVLSEDNPNIMHETKSIQTKGKTYICGIKIEKIHKKESRTKDEIYEHWFE